MRIMLFGAPEHPSGVFFLCKIQHIAKKTPDASNNSRLHLVFKIILIELSEIVDRYQLSPKENTKNFTVKS